MEKKVLFISEKSSNFFANAIQSNLKEDGYEIICTRPDINEISKLKEKPALILLYLDNIWEENNDFFFFMKDLCIEEEKRLYLIGYENEIAAVKGILSQSIIRGAFVRPLNVKELIEKMNMEMEQYMLEADKRHVLVVDDSGEMLWAVKEWLSGKYRVSMVNSSANAIAFLANHKPDLILLDYEMPICNGPQMMSMIRAEVSTGSIPIMFLTSKSDAESVKKVLELKPEGYMLKTMKPHEIVDTIDKFFDSRKGTQY